MLTALEGMALVFIQGPVGIFLGSFALAVLFLVWRDGRK